MNSAAGQRGKKRTKLEVILRQDHSDIYFDNERLNDELNNRIDSLHKEHHRHEMLRQIEIGKLRREIDELKALRTTKAEEQLQEINARPHTTGDIDRRYNNVPKGSKSAKSLPRSAIGKTKGLTAKDLELYGRNSPPPLSTDSESTLRNPKTLRKYRHVNPAHFRQNNKFPQEWYTKCIPASDAVLHKNRRVNKSRGKSAPPKPTFDFLAKLRENEENDRSLRKFDRKRAKAVIVRPTSAAETMTDISEVEGMSLLCDQPVKPIVMSLRRLKEISHMDNVTDRGPSRNTQRMQGILERNLIEKRRIDIKVRQFCKDIEALKESEAREEREREETRRREAQEKSYMKTVEGQ